MNEEKKLTYNEYLQIEGLFTLMKAHGKGIQDCEQAAGLILNNGKHELDAAWPLNDSMWDFPDSIKPALIKAGYKIEEKTK